MAVKGLNKSVSCRLLIAELPLVHPGLCDQDVLLASLWREVQEANSQLTQTLTKWDELDQALSEVLEPMPVGYIG